MHSGTYCLNHQIQVSLSPTYGYSKFNFVLFGNIFIENQENDRHRKISRFTKQIIALQCFCISKLCFNHNILIKLTNKDSCSVKTNKIFLSF